MNSHLIPAVAAFIKKHGEKTLRAGDTISYNHPVLNHLISNVVVIAVDPTAECYPLKLDTNELLPYTHHIIVEQGPKRQRRSIRSHTLVEGKVNVPTRRDKFAAAVRNISSEVFASAQGNHEPSKNLEYHITQEENVCIPNEIAAKIFSPVQPEVEVCQTGGMEGISSAEISGVPSQEDMDIRDHIPPVLIYESPEEAKRLMNSFARQHGYALVVADTQRDRTKVKYRVVFACDRYGTYKPKPKTSVGVKHRVNTATRKCGCPLRINLYLNRSSLKWHVHYDLSVGWYKSYDGKELHHNHEVSTNSASHPTHRQPDMTHTVRESILEDAKLGIKPSATLSRILNMNPTSAITRKDVNNVRHTIRRNGESGHEKMATLFELLCPDTHFCSHKVDSARRITHLFFALREAVAIFKANPDVILMDCTYKTNEFDMPLLNVVGVTGMNTTIHFAQAFMEGETEQDYLWSLAQLKQIFAEEEIDLPQVVFSDCDVALMNSLEVVMPDIPVILCVWHIISDVKKHAIQNFAFLLEQDSTGQYMTQTKPSADRLVVQSQSVK